MLKIHFKDHPTSTTLKEPWKATANSEVKSKKGRLEVALKDVSQMCVHLFRRSIVREVEVELNNGIWRNIEV